MLHWSRVCGSIGLFISIAIPSFPQNEAIIIIQMHIRPRALIPLCLQLKNHPIQLSLPLTDRHHHSSLLLITQVFMMDHSE